MRIPILLLSLLLFKGVAAQEINPALLRGGWKAAWISCPAVPQKDYGVYHFRKEFTLQEGPGRFVVHVTGDNRYRLFVNGTYVCNGPARGDLTNWYFETLDIAPYLKAGRNVIAAEVWNMGTLAPVAQISNQTGFLLQGDGPAEAVVNTDRSWKVALDSAYTPCSVDNGSRLRSYMVVGPGDRVDAARHPWGWETPGYDDSRWATAVTVTNGVVHGYGTDNLWTLKPRSIPLMREQREELELVRRVSGLAMKTPFRIGKAGIHVPANSKVSILLDREHLTVAYPEITLSGGKGSSVTLTYAEALFDPQRQKGNRNEIEGKEIIGNYDIFLPDGAAGRRFRPLWFRTYRFVQIDIATAAQPLQVDGIHGMATGYPFEVKAEFDSDDRSLRQIWDIGWRTAQLCAGETYFDCPYYEQLQYEGDTRIQSLISLYVTGDDRLMRKAILDFDHSRVPEGLTQGRYPSNRLQVIPPFSLFWVSMIHDFWMHRRDDAFISGLLQPVSGVLHWFEQRIDTSLGMLGPLTWWNFVDWDRSFRSGTPDGATDGHSSIVSLQFAYTLRQAAELFEHYGRIGEATRYRSLAERICRSTYRACFDTDRGVIANTPLRNTYSQHASIIGVLSGAVPAHERAAVMGKVLTDTSLSQATFYYRFYLTRALNMAGLSNLYYRQLAPWRGMIANGLTTFAENPDPTRSDCHAWSSSPNYDFLATLCGITPASPGFATVRIEPSLGELSRVSGRMPHPAGEIRVSVDRTAGGGCRAVVSLPPGIHGSFVWDGRPIVLEPGENRISR